MFKSILITILFGLVIVALMMLGLGIKMLFRKNGQFKRHCSSVDPYTGEHAGCVCRQASNVKCKAKERYSPLEVNDNLIAETRQ